MRTLEQIESGIAQSESEREKLLGWKPNAGERFWYPNFGSQDMANNHLWEGDPADRLLRSRRLIFKTKEEAVACAKRMLEAVGE